MHLTKIWLFLVSLGVGAAMALAILVPRPALRELEREQTQRLQDVQVAAQLQLKLYARVMMDYAAHLATDAVLVGALDETSRGATDKALHQTALERLRVFVQPARDKQRKIAFLVAVDARGRVLARATDAGEGDAEAWGYSMAGFPVVADAVRGYRAEDIFAQNGRIFMVAASPVFSRGRDHYVGALLVGTSAGDEQVARMHDALGVDVALLLRGRLVASTLSSPALLHLGEAIGRRSDEIAREGRTGPIALEGGHDLLWGMATPLPGEAALQDAYYVLLMQRPVGSGLGGFLRAASGEDVRWANFPWLPIVMMALLVLGVAIGLLFFEAEGPLGRLRDEAARLAAGEIPRLSDRGFRGRFGAIVRSINAALERTPRAAGLAVVPRVRREASAGSARLPAAAGSGPIPVAAAAHESEADGAAGSNDSDTAETNAQLAAPPLPPGVGRAGGLPSFRLGDGTGEGDGAGRGSDLADLASIPQLDAVALDGAETTVQHDRPPSASNRAAAQPGRTGSQPQKASLGAGEPGEEPRGKTPPPVVPSPLAEGFVGGNLPSFGALSGSGAGASADFGDATLIAPPSKDLIEKSTPPSSGEDLEGTFRKIYQEFVDLKRKCGEPTESVTYERFVAKLRENRDQLMKKFNCKSVRFQVYIKDGRAALKATPVRE